MVWVYLFVGGFFECVWAVSMKYSEGFTKLWPSIVTVLSMIASLWLLSLAMKSLPAGTAYAVWTGIGAVGVAVAGMLLFDEPRELIRILSILLIVAGVLGLRLL